jgi:acyl-[acyl-carrier-protein]-phospholipid O-acyltransferase/long-chain-fatty-acid--[acyl-carrier-protein] ligase
MYAGMKLKSTGFRSFLWTQFLGAFNDNLCKMAVSLRAVHVAASGGADYLALSGAVFVLPFLLFSGFSGHLADRFSKRSVLVSVKAFEILVMAIGIAAFFSTRMELMLLVLFLMALHSTVFSPAKYGIVPEMIDGRDLSRANGLLEMSTFVAIVLGTSVGAIWKFEVWKLAVAMLGVAVVGFVTSLRIPRIAPSGASGAFSWNPFGEVLTGTRHLLRDRPLTLTVAGISYFWFLGALFQMDLLLVGKEVLHASDLRVGLMVTSLAVGIGAGSLLAGRWSGDKVELGLVPLGSLLMGVCCLGLYAGGTSYGWCVAMLALLGVASGLFIVPLNAFLQQRGGATEKGRLIATNNFYNTVAILAASGTLWLLHDRLRVSADKLVLIFGLATLAGTIYLVRLVPDFLTRFVLWLFTHTIYRIRIVGAENIPTRGAALLVANHVSHVDGFLIGSTMQRFVRFMLWRPYYESKALGWFFRLLKSIPVGGGSARETAVSIRQAREELAAGHVVCIFPEGAITRTGNILPFKRGFERIAEGLDVPVIPVHLDGVWGSIFSFAGGRFFRKWPRRIPFPVTVSFGKPMPSTATAHEARQAIQELAPSAVELRKTSRDTLPLRFVSSARANWRRFAMADSTGRELTYGRALTASVLLARWTRRHCGSAEMVGVLLPASAAGALVNIGVSMAGKVPVNLNFTAGREAMESAAQQCSIRTIVTSKAFVAKAKIEQIEGMVYVEDILAAQSPIAKIGALVAARLAPARMLVSGSNPDAPATVIFSSGSTGVPKGVVLSHYNVIANIEAIAQVYSFGREDRIIGALPFFHSFGFTVTIWFPLIGAGAVAYHPNPLDAKAIAALVQKYRGTFLLSTPTFCTGYTRKCSREEFATLRHVLVGAEKLRESVAQAFREAFGVELMEGYGCTEMAPVVAVNAPGFVAGRNSQIAAKAGTVGQPLPGVAVRIVDPATHAPLPAGREGLLLVKGANRMLGYLNRPVLTDEAVADGWYNTGDIAALDEDGFLRITDRLSRFSKIGGEMVPHLKVEEAVYGAIGEHRAMVTGIPDDHRGERLVVLYTRPDMTPSELWRALAASDLPRLWLPKREDIFQVESIPVLGTGKVDLRGAKSLALDCVERGRILV